MISNFFKQFNYILKYIKNNNKLTIRGKTVYFLDKVWISHSELDKSC